MKQALKETVDKWIEDEQRVFRLKVVRINDPWQGMSDEEIEDRREFIRCYLLKDLEPVLMLPVQPRESGFWFESAEEFEESAFNTWDFQRTQKPFDKYDYRLKKILEHIQDLAVMHSCISQSEGRENIKARFELILRNEFRDPLLSIIEQFRRTSDEERIARLRANIAKLSRHIMECKAIWQRYSPWEEGPSSRRRRTTEDVQTSSVRQEEVFQTRIDEVM